MTTELILTDLERLVYTWLVERNIEFDFQSSLMGGRIEFGGAVVDFILVESGILLRVFGEYWHTGLVQEAKDREQRSMLEGLGYRVVDLHEEELTTNLDAVMEKAIMGDEMSEIDTDLLRGNPGMAAGMITGLGDPTSKIPPSHTTPVVRTDLAVSNVLNGTLVYDGGIECDCWFKWGEAVEEAGCLRGIFPFNCLKFYYQITQETPIHCLDFIEAPDNLVHETPFQRNKRTDDTFDKQLSIEEDTWYAYLAKARNPSYSVDGAVRCFMGV